MLFSKLVKLFTPKKSKNQAHARPLLLINADTSSRSAIPADRTKERLADFAILKAGLNADILDWNDINKSRPARLLAKYTGKGPALAMLAFLRRNRYQLFYCDGETNGLPLALMFKFSFTRKPLLMIGHWIVPPKKAVMFKFLRIQTHITTIFLHSSAQYDKAINNLGIPARKLKLLPYQVDTDFWRMENATVSPTEKPYICTVGLEFRDYPTLIEAVREMPLDLKIAAASKWSKRKDSTLNVKLPANVAVGSHNYTELRDLYAGCEFVVVPLYETDSFQAGITVILEAMAMGKAVIVSRTSGQGDTIVDRRRTLRTGPEAYRDTTGKFIELFGGEKFEEMYGATGFYVNPGSVEALSRAISYLREHPEVAAEMGKRGRHTVASLMSVEQFYSRIKNMIAENTGDLLDFPTMDFINHSIQPIQSIQPIEPISEMRLTDKNA